MKKKKWIALMTALAMTTGLLAGCGGTDAGAGSTSADNAGSDSAAQETATDSEAAEEGEAEQTEDAGAAEDGAVEASGTGEAVTIWYYWETEGHQVALDQVIQEYNGSQDQYEVTAKYVPFADFKKQLSIGASADELPDIAILDSPDHASYVEMGIFVDWHYIIMKIC